MIQNLCIPLCPHPFFDHDLEPSYTTLHRHPLASCGSRGFIFSALGMLLGPAPLWTQGRAMVRYGLRIQQCMSEYEWAQEHEHIRLWCFFIGGTEVASLHTEPYRVICYRYRLDLRPGEHCKSKIVSGMKNFRCLSAARSHWKLGQLS